MRSRDCGSCWHDSNVTALARIAEGFLDGVAEIFGFCSGTCYGLRKGSC